MSERDQVRGMEQSYASFAQRLGAGIVDFVLVLPITIAAAFFGRKSPSATLAAECIQFMLVAPYQPAMHASFGQTVGKMAFHIEVRRTDGTVLTWANSLRRSCVDLVLGTAMTIASLWAWSLFPIDSFAQMTWAQRVHEHTQLGRLWFPVLRGACEIWVWGEFITMLFNKRRRAVHDFLGGTVVVQRPP
jgi:uncharacterized RDD family membrane protein YckC